MELIFPSLRLNRIGASSASPLPCFLQLVLVIFFCFSFTSTATRPAILRVRYRLFCGVSWRAGLAGSGVYGRSACHAAGCCGVSGFASFSENPPLSSTTIFPKRSSSSCMHWRFARFPAGQIPLVSGSGPVHLGRLSLCSSPPAYEDLPEYSYQFYLAAHILHRLPCLLTPS